MIGGGDHRCRGETAAGRVRLGADIQQRAQDRLILLYGLSLLVMYSVPATRAMQSLPITQDDEDRGYGK